jgi:hypothetical protein
MSQVRTEDVEVFVITCGARPSFPRALAAAEGQVPAAPVTVVRDVAPMSAAFQRMLTAGHGRPYFVQVDDDMILAPDAIAKLCAAMSAAPAWAAICGLWLYDPHVERPIVGVKLYRREAIEEVGGWSDEQSCEMGQLARLKAAGWSVEVPWVPGMGKDDPHVVGLHDPMFTPESAFERYRDLMVKQRRLGHALWVEELPELFLRRLRAMPAGYPGQAVDTAAFAGCVAGLTADLAHDWSTGEKDFRACPWRAEFDRLAKVLKL